MQQDPPARTVVLLFSAEGNKPRCNNFCCILFSLSMAGDKVYFRKSENVLMRTFWSGTKTRMVSSAASMKFKAWYMTSLLICIYPWGHMGHISEPFLAAFSLPLFYRGCTSTSNPMAFAVEGNVPKDEHDYQSFDTVYRLMEFLRRVINNWINFINFVFPTDTRKAPSTQCYTHVGDGQKWIQFDTVFSCRVMNWAMWIYRLCCYQMTSEPTARWK